MQRISKYGDIQNLSLLPIKSYHFDVLIAFLHHHIQESYTFKNDPVFGQPCI